MMKRDDYTRIMDGIRPCKTIKYELEARIMKQHYTKPVVKVAVVAVVCFGLVAMLVFGIPLLKSGSDGGASVLRLFVTTAYAAGADQPSNSADVELKPDVKTVLGSYSPLMSSVPGFPFYAQCATADRILVETTRGSIALWSEADSKIYDQGKQYSAKPSEKIYWSVVDQADGASAVQQASLKFTAYKGDQKLGEQTVLISQGQDFMYTAEFVK